MENQITLTVNGQPRSLTVTPTETLAEALRVRLKLTGTKIGCDGGECGAVPAGECVEDVDGDVGLAALFDAAVVVGADTGEVGEFLEKLTARREALRAYHLGTKWQVTERMRRQSGGTEALGAPHVGDSGVQTVGGGATERAAATVRGPDGAGGHGQVAPAAEHGQVHAGAAALHLHRDDVVEPSRPCRHRRATTVADSLDDRRAVRAVEPDRVGEIRRTELPVARAVCAVTDGAVGLEDFRPRGARPALAGEAQGIVGRRGELPLVECMMSRSPGRR